jgi:tetratricopeptide (TPR) repeat protein
MNKRLLSRIVLILGLAVGLVRASAAFAADDQSLEQARKFFDRGQELYAEGNFDKAAEQFKKAHEARPYPQFLFNVAACYEKSKAYGKAVDFYKQYLAADPNAADKADVEKRVTVLEKEAASAKPNTPANPPSEAVTALGEAEIRGLVVIESEPSAATIYLDDKKGKPLAKTPWNGKIEGTHTIFIEREGYKQKERKISPNPKALTVFVFDLAEEDYLGWIKITSNVPGANIYLDKKEFGVQHQTPWQGNIEPGKHTIWVVKDGYAEFKQEIEIVRGKTHDVQATLKGSPVGYLQVRGDVDKAEVWVDGKLLCKSGPCRKPVKGGEHTVEIRREDYKSYEKTVNLQPKTEVTITPRLAEKPSRVDAIIAYTISAAFIGTGIWAGMEAKDLKKENDATQEMFEMGLLPEGPSDTDKNKEKGFRVGSYVAYGCGAVSLATAIWYTFREKGPPSTGSTDVKQVAITPEFSPEYAGLGMNVAW